MKKILALSIGLLLLCEAGRAQTDITVNDAAFGWYDLETYYDGTSSYTPALLSRLLTFSGLAAGDKLVYGVDYTISSAVFANSAAGTDKTLSIYVQLENTTLANKYRLTNGNPLTSVRADVNKRELTLTGGSVAEKPWDNNTSATITSLTFSGLADGETLTRSTDYTATAQFQSVSLGSGKPVTVTLALSSTAAAANYQLTATQVAGKVTGNIYRGRYDITANAAEPYGWYEISASYDGTRAYVLGYMLRRFCTFTGLVEDTLTYGVDYRVDSAVFADAMPGANKPLSVYVSLLINDKTSHYTLTNGKPYPGAPRVTINKAELRVSGGSVQDKFYDGATAATLDSLTFSGLVNGDRLIKGTDYTATVNFQSPSIGTDKPVVVSASLISNSKTNGYTLLNGANNDKVTGRVYECSITYSGEMNGYTPAPTRYNKTDLPLTLPVPSATCCKFNGWYDNPNFDDPNFVGSPITVLPTDATGNKTFYASWTTRSYAVTFDAQDGSAVEPQTVDYNGKVTRPSPPAKLGYKFLDWYRGLESTSIAWNFDADVVTSPITLYAKWELEPYTITYVLDGGDNSPNNPTTYNVTSSITLADPTKAGHKFLDWFDNSSFTGNVVTDISPNTTTGNKTFFAKWEVNTYQVTFNANGGSTVPAQTVNYNSKATDPNLTRTGYTLAGWYKEVAFTNLWNFSSEVVTEAVALYAKWDTTKYTITYTPNGGKNNPANPTTYTVNSSFSLYPATDRTGHKFGGWLSTYNLDGSAVTGISAGTTEDKTFFAKWIVDTFTVTFIPNVSGGSVSVPQQRVTYAGKVALPTDPTWAGYKLAGWYRESGLTTRWDFTSDTVTSNISLYAKWTVDTFRINYVMNDGTNHHQNPATYTVNSNGVTLQTPNKTGHKFDGWFDNYRLEGISVAGIPAGATGEKTFYAKWTINTFDVTFNTNGGSTVAPQKVNYGSTAENPSATKSGYTLAGWYEYASTIPWDFATKITEAVTLYAKWDTVRYTITYVLDGGDNSPNNPSTYTINNGVTLSPATKTGHEFGGWYDAPGFPDDAVVTGILKGTVGHQTFYAKWTVITFNVEFDANGGSTVAPQKIAHGGKVTPPDDDPQRLGYEFKGWYKESGFSNLWSFSTDVVTKATILYAKWAVITYDINYNLDGGVNNNQNPDSYDVTKSFTLFPATGRIGHRFGGWYEDFEFKDSEVTLIPLGTTEPKIFFARWIPDTLNVVFNTYGGGTVATQKVAYGKRATSPTPPPTKRGYSFGGWYKETGLTNQWSFNTAVTEGVTLHAKWDIETYVIAYALGDDGVNDSRNPDSYDITSNITPLYSATRAGYKFDGWYGKSDFDGGKVSAIPTGSTGDTTLYAKWTIGSYTITFNTNGGSTVAQQTANYGDKVVKPNDPIRAGYTLAGWYKDAKFDNEWSFDVDEVKESITLYAKWGTEIYYITYEPNGGTNPATNPTSYTVSNNRVTLLPATRDGCTFRGWYEHANFSGTSVSYIPPNATGDRDFYAKWDTIEYEIYYETYGGVNNEQNPNSYTFYDYVSLYPATKTGSAFDGWYESEDFNGSAVVEIPQGSKDEKAFYAKWTTAVFNVTFSTVGGSTVATQRVTYGGKATRPADDPTKTGYKFRNWYREQEGANVWSFATAITQDVTIYAKWEPETYTLTFDAEPVAITPSTRQVTYDVAVGTLPAPTRTGYTLKGWFTQPNGEGVRYEQETLYRVTGNTTLYAHWEGEICTVTLNFNDNSVTADQQVQVRYGDTVPRPANPERSDYTFTGWWRDADGKSSWSFPSDKVAGSITLYAGWTQLPTVTVTFVSNGATVDDQIVVEGRTVAQLTDPTRTGYTFGGWYKEAACTNLWNFATTVTQSIKLYAKWTANSYTLTFDANPATANPSSKQVTYGAAVGALPAPTQAGYTFGGWFAEANGGGKRYDKDTIYRVDRNTTLYAKWTANSYALSFNASPGTVTPTSKTVTYGAAVGALPTLTRTGYTLKGWFTQPNGGGVRYEQDTIYMVAGNTLLYARWEGNPCTVTLNFNDNSGRADQQLPLRYGDTIPRPTNPERSGYIFIGWSKNANGNSRWNFPTDRITSDATLYACWTAETTFTCTVTFDSNGGSVVDRQTVVKDRIVAQLTDPERTGYTFGGWYREAAFTNEWIFATDTVTQDITLHAKWTANSYTLSFDASSGTVSPSSKSVTYGAAVGELPTPTSTQAGYTFGGWFTEANGGGKRYEQDAIYRVAGDTTLYAHWTAGVGGSGLLIFNADPVSVLPQSMPVTYGEEVGELPAPSRTGYTFGGWFTETDGRGERYTASSVYLGIGVFTTVNLYACWEKIFLLDTITVNGVTVVDSSGSGVFYYDDIPCGDTDSTLSITLSLPAGVSCNRGNPFTVSTRFPSALDTTFTLSYVGSAETKTYQLHMKKPLDFDYFVHRQLGDRLLMVVNNPQNNDGHRFLKATWVINGERELGSRFYYVSPNGKPITGVVELQLVDSATGSEMNVCPYTFTSPDTLADVQTLAYPNPVAAGGVVHLRTAGGSAAVLPDGSPAERYATYRLLDVQGALQRSGSASELQNGLTMPNLPGSYLLILEGKTGKTAILIVVGG
jgi:uncharacterized repeat protein (TIGR02543 family)